MSNQNNFPGIDAITLTVLASVDKFMCSEETDNQYNFVFFMFSGLEFRVCRWMYWQKTNNGGECECVITSDFVRFRLNYGG